MSKYVIRNCPAIYGIFLDGCKKDHYEDGTVLCQDCTDCLLKQIVKECTNSLRFSCERILAEKLLGLLDIQEVE